MSDTFVLVHGAWHGAWCWAGVQRHLEEGGDRTFAVDLPSHGASKFDRAKVNLQVYVDSVAKFIEERDLRDVVIAGHSMGGLVISGVAQKIPKRLKRVVFVTAFVMLDGERAIDLSRPEMKALGDVAASRPDRSIPIEVMEARFREAFIQDASKDLQDFVVSALAPQPLAPLADPVPMKEFYKLDIPTSYVICEDDVALAPQIMWHPHFSSRLKNPTTRSIKSGHEVMFTKPVECARALHELARG
jgi:pimeloyl-ACP methyl ester carboxylesterase